MPYKDTIGRKLACKPGYRTPPIVPSPAEAAHLAFSKNLIKALEEAAAAPVFSSSERLAEAACAKLQYDFPLLSDAEASALIEELRVPLDGSRWPRLQLTNKLLENVVDGAASVVAVPDVNAAPCALGAVGAAVKPQVDAHTAWQQLAMCVVVKLMRRLLEATPQDAYQQLCRLHAEPSDQPQKCLNGSQQQQQQHQLEETVDTGEDTEASVEEWRIKHVCDSLAMSPAGPEYRATALPSQLPVDTAAAAAVVVGGCGGSMSNDDDEVYEPLMPPLPLPPHRLAATAVQHSDSAAPYSWQRFLAKLQAIARHAQHALLADKIAWHQLALVDDVVAIVAATAAAAVPATGVTGGGQPGMGGIQAVYLSLLIQHMVDAPEAVTAFPALCVALGVSSSTPRSCAPGLRPLLPQALRSAMLTATTLFEGLSAAASKRMLSSSVQSTLLLPIGAWLGLLVGSKAAVSALCLAPTSSDELASRGAAAEPCDATPTADIETDLAIACQLIETTMVTSSGSSATSLLSSGAFRGMAALFARGARGVPVLGRALLVSTAARVDLAAWVAAVPGVRARLSAAAATAAGREPAGACSRKCRLVQQALWVAVLPPLPGTMPSAPDGMAEPLAALLRLEPALHELAQVEALEDGLQLMAACQAVANRRPLWGSLTNAALKDLSAAINAIALQAAAEATGVKAAAASREQSMPDEADRRQQVVAASPMASSSMTKDAKGTPLEGNGVGEAHSSNPSNTRTVPDHDLENEKNTGLRSPSALRGACQRCSILLKQLTALDGNSKSD